MRKAILPPGDLPLIDTYWDRMQATPKWLAGGRGDPP
jgi:hypothetical protein